MKELYKDQFKIALGHIDCLVDGIVNDSHKYYYLTCIEVMSLNRFIKRSKKQANIDYIMKTKGNR